MSDERPLSEEIREASDRMYVGELLDEVIFEKLQEWADRAEELEEALRTIRRAAHECNESAAQAIVALATCGQIADAALAATEEADS